MKIKKASERVKELAQEIHNKGIDPGFSGYQPDLADYVSAIVVYLDEKPYQKKVGKSL